MMNHQSDGDRGRDPEVAERTGLRLEWLVTMTVMGRAWRQEPEIGRGCVLAAA